MRWKEYITEAKIKGETSKDDGHIHTYSVDQQGNGKTDYRKHGNNVHGHKIKKWKVQFEDGHSHEIKKK